MRTTILLGLLLLGATSVAAAPIELGIGVHDYTFDNLVADSDNASCGAGTYSTCLEYNLLSGTGTLQLSLIDADGQTVATGALADGTFGLAGIGIGLPYYQGIANTVRVEVTGDLVFDYFALDFVNRLSGTVMEQAVVQGIRPVPPPHISPSDPPPIGTFAFTTIDTTIGTPEPSSLLLCGVAALISLWFRRRKFGQLAAAE